ncbi:2-phosphosulfolactate phosphatase [Clostridium botulinum]|uniref:2-phosphosulfolactate phosphatase family protein n=1 Tax=Clostridium botulinum TaxID=1491 RepID=UPI0004660C7B|nr:2-phosphosulfolactate phosphatase family protein [Clostridium botulinum]APQ72534.1 putative 2-phosphosulfolactate phosphatase [Clostridium botulinum]APQ97163.1 putative 2-phosphosulfolactate phosphatase [Clostridium botulinum]AUM89576.1 2-phosphosulfolactate phosphatase [Clostridium botulinum]AUN12541.1 2-phosphosulfolactate phosphatase [Clostridium botulinum]AUN23531.1 2-phosphosulfolactate phosphatase [Clostridium botulinum]
MNIDIVISADHIDEKRLINKTVIIIDILRATSVITTAINNGCKKVIPVLTVEEAKDIAKNSEEDIILGGERNALKIDGFNFSNSPLEYTKKYVEGKTVVLSTTNGTRAINNSFNAKTILISALINSKATAKAIDKLHEDLIIINSGTNGQFSIDDFICSGYLIDCLYNIRKDLELSDIAKTAHYIYTNNKDIESFVKKATHYSRLKSLNLEKDLEYCFQKDIIDVVPQYKDGYIIKSNI